MGRLSLLLACSVTGAAALVLPAGAAPTSPSLNLDQCRNGAAASPENCDSTTWNNGNLNPQQAHYVEGESAPYRLVMENLPLGQNVTVVLEYDVKHGGKHAIDFLTHYDRLPGTAVFPIAGVTGLSSTVSTWPVPAPSSTGSPVAGQPTASFNALPQAERVMTLFGGTLSGMAYGTQGDLASTGNSSALMSVTFQADSATAVLAWGGHIASSEDWGAGNSAGGVSGAPYHMAIDSWTLGNVGSTDRSMQAAVVAPSAPNPARLTVTKVVVNDNGGINVVGDFQLFIGDNQVTSGAANSLPAGSYTVSEGPHAGYTSTIGGACAVTGAITLTAGQVAECTITNNDIAPPPPGQGQLVVTKVVINDDGGTGVVGDFDLFVNAVEVASGAPSNLAPGLYTVTEGAHPAYTSTIGGDCAANGAITLVAGQTYQCTITNNDVAAAPEIPAAGPEVDSGTETAPVPVQAAPVSTLPTTGSAETPGPQTAPTVTSELPRTGAGVREQSLLALALLASGLVSSALGRRRTRPSAV
jgi:hypothetical protein